jgi:hypothetical protein
MRRPASSALLLSVTLHCAIAAALLGLRYHPAAPPPEVVSFQLIALEDGTAADAGRAEDAPDAPAAPDNALTGHDEEVAAAGAPVDADEPLGVDEADSMEIEGGPAGAAASDRNARASDPREAASTETALDREQAEPPRQRGEPREGREAHRDERAPPERPEPSREQHAQNAGPTEDLREQSPPAPTSNEKPHVPPALPEVLASAAPPEPNAAPPRLDPPSDPEPTTEADRPILAAVAPEPLDVTVPPAAIEPPRPTRPVSETQRREVKERIEDWAASLDETPPSRPSQRSRPARQRVEWQHKGQTFAATFEQLPAEDDMHLEQVVMSLTTRLDGRLLSTKLQLKKLAFSSFAQFVDRWDPNVHIRDDRIDGRFHSNSKIYVERSRGVTPVFLGKVTTTRGVDTSYSSRPLSRRKVFLGGVETHAERIPLPRRFASLRADLDGADADRIQRVDADTRVTFYADGSIGWKDAEAGGQERRRELPSDEPFYFVAGEKAKLYLSGVVDGKVLVYSPKEIVIVGDLIYASDPRADPASDDYLGLVSDGDVEVADPETTGPGDLDVQASIYARRRFAIRNFMRNEHATLSVYGSVTAGSLSATEPRYSTNVQFDRRFEDARPPSFPMTDHYEIAAWDGRWTVEPETLDEPPTGARAGDSDGYAADD